MDFISYINNAALLLVFSLLSINIQSRWLKREPGKSIALGCLYGLSTALAMNIPMVLQPGVFFDGRSVILSLAGLFTSNVTTVIACLIAAVVRVFIGGPGVFTGVGSVIISGLWGIIFRRIVEKKQIQLGLKHLFIFGFINHLVLVGWFFTLPFEIALGVIQNVAVPYLTVFPLATMLIGRFMQEQQQRVITEKNLEASEKRYRDLVDTLNEGVWSVDKNAVTTFINPKMAEMLGYDVKQIIGKSIYDFISKNDRAEFDAIQERRQKGIKEQFELELFCKDGSKLFTLVGITSLFDEDGEYAGLLAGVQDITALKMTQEKLAEQSRHLEDMVEERTRDLKDAQALLIKAEKMATLGELAGSVGHELRNPLAVISNSAYLLKTILVNGDQQVKDYIRMIEKETHDASRIINDLLDYSRIQSYPKEAIDLSELVTGILDRQEFPDNIKIENYIAKNLPSVKANDQQLEQVFINIISNAIEAMPDGGILKLTSRKGKQKLTISIADAGIGISKKDIKRIFEPLFTTKPRGVGLGLSITSKLAELNNIKIRVKSVVGKGSTFSLDFSILA